MRKCILQLKRFRARGINEKQGFTLVEIMVAVFLSTIVLGGVYGIWTQVSRHILSNAKQKLQHEETALIIFKMTLSR